MGHERLEMEALQLIFKFIYAKKERNEPPGVKQGISKAKPRRAMLFAPSGFTHPPPPVPPFLLTQNLQRRFPEVM